MVMEAIAASLHDADIKEAEQKDRDEDSRNGRAPPAPTSRLEAFSQMLRLSRFRTSRRNGSS